MVSYASSNALSMLGGDDYSTIQEEIEVLDASVVHKTGNLAESINGVKTFVSDFNVNSGATNKLSITSTDTTLNNFSHVMNSTADISLQIGGVPSLYLDSNNTQLVGENVLIEGTSPVIGSLLTTPISFTTNSIEKLNIQTNETTITNPNVFIVDDSTGLTNVKFSDEEVIIKAPNGASTFDIQGALMRIDGSSGGINQLFFGAVNPFSSIEFRNTSMLFLNTDVVITTDATSTTLKQMGISATSTTAGDLIFLLNKRTGTGADFTASGYRMIRENATGDFVLQRRTTSSGGISTNTAIQRISGTTSETFTMPTQTKVATTAFKVQTIAGTDKLNITPTATELSNVEIIAQASTGNIALLMGPTGELVVQNNTIEKLNIATSVTNITNTSINADGNFYAPNYRIGSSGGTNRRLASFALPGGSCLIPTATGSGTTTTTGTWSYTGSSSQMRTPDWGNFFPLYAIIGLDNGSITGGGTMTFAVQLREETNNFTIATTAQTLTSGTNNASTGASQNFNVYSSANQDIGNGVLVRFQIVISRTASITASTKSIFATIYGYQTN